MDKKTIAPKSVPLRASDYAKLKEIRAVAKTNAEMARFFNLPLLTITNVLKKGSSSPQTIKLVTAKIAELEGVDIHEAIFGEFV